MSRPDLLGLAATYARPVLVTGLLAGVALPDLAGLLSGWIPEMVVLLLFLGALRLSPDDLLKLRTGLPAALALVLVLQLALPMTILALAFLLNAATAPLTLALVLLTCAPPIVSSPNIATMMGLSAPTAMQMMILGTVLLPVTALPVFWFMPMLGSSDQIIGAVLRLMITIVLAGGGAILLRRVFLPTPGARLIRQLDGLSALALAVFVIALMPAVSGSIANNTGTFGFWLFVAFAANFGAQAAMLGVGRGPVGGARALVAGNRNISLFFVALPQDLTAPLLLFLGCYQLPMLLTPVLLPRLYRS